MQPETSQPAAAPQPQQQPVEIPPVAEVPVQPLPVAEEVPRQTPTVTMSMGEVAMTGDVVTDGQPAAQKITQGPGGVVEWDAQEYITTDKNPVWYAGLAVFVVGGILLDIFVLKAFFTVAALVVVVAIVLIVMHVRPARVIHYTLDDEGLRVGDQLYPMGDYKSFGVLHDGKENSIHLIPVKRFKPSLQVYFPVEAGEAIVDSLGSRLPMEELHPDFIDRIVNLFRL